MQKVPTPELLQKLAARETRFGGKVVDALKAFVGATAAPEPELVIPLRNAKPGMRLRQEIRSQTGALLVPYGFEMSERLLQRLSQVAPEVLDQPARLAPAKS